MQHFAERQTTTRLSVRFNTLFGTFCSPFICTTCVTGDSLVIRLLNLWRKLSAITSATTRASRHQHRFHYWFGIDRASIGARLAHGWIVLGSNTDRTPIEQWPVAGDNDLVGERRVISSCSKWIKGISINAPFIDLTIGDNLLKLFWKFIEVPLRGYHSMGLLTWVRRNILTGRRSMVLPMGAPSLPQETPGDAWG